MNDKNEEDKTKNSKYYKQYYLYTYDREERHNTRYHKGEHKKYDSYYDRTKIEEDHSIVELHSDTDMAYCHSCRERERLYDSAVLENNKKFRIRKTHIQKKCKY